MASIKKLQIQGIRSYDPYKPVNVEFYKPLTLIVGHNGSGKTTIIEALRAGFTGELPPNCKQGRSFIYDPKMAGESEIKAKIKIKFTDVNGDEVVVSRAYQLTTTAANAKFKTLEGSLETYSQGQRVSVSHRCVDMNSIIPTMVGVSKPIIDSVIFCHQDESLWPMSDDSTLKKKFDDIFAATRYTQALKCITDYKKETKHRLDLIKKDVELVQQQKTQADSLNRDRTQKEALIKQIDVELQQLQTRLSSVQQQLEVFSKHEKELQVLETKKREYSQEREILGVQLQHIQSRMTSRIEDSEEVLDALEERAKEEVAQWHLDAGRVERDVDDLRKAISKWRVDKEQLQERHSALKHAHISYEENLQERLRVVQKLIRSQELPVEIPAHGPPDRAIGRFKELLSQKVEQRKTTLETNRKVRAERMRKCRQQVDKATAEETLHLETINRTETELHSINKELEIERTKIAKSKRDAQRLRKAEQDLKAAQDELDVKMKASGNDERAEVIKRLEKDLRAMETERNEIISEMTEASETDKKQVLLREKQEQRERRRDKMLEIMENNRTKFSELLQCQPRQVEEETIDLEVENRAKLRLDELQKDEAELMRLQYAFDAARDRDAQLQREYREKVESREQVTTGVTTDLAKLSSDCVQLCKKKDVQVSAENLQRIAELVTAEIEEVELSGGMSKHYMKCLPDMVIEAKRDVTNHACPVCTRSCTSKELQVLENNVKGILENIERAGHSGMQAERLRRDQDRLLTIKSDHARALRLGEECGELSGKCDKVRDEVATLQVDFDTCNEKVKEMRRGKPVWEQLLEDARTVGRLRAERDEFDKELKFIKSSISQSLGASRSMMELKDQKDRLDHGIESKRKALDKTKKEFTREREGLHTLEGEIHKQQRAMYELKDSAQEAQSAELKIKMLENKQMECSSRLEKTKAARNQIRADMAQYEEQLRVQSNETEREDTIEAQALERIISEEREYREITRKIHHYEQGGDSLVRLQEADEGLKSLQAKISEQEEALRAKEEQRRLFDSNISGPQKSLENIQRNKEFNRANAQWKQLTAHLNEVERETTRLLSAEGLTDMLGQRDVLRREERELESVRSEKSGRQDAYRTDTIRLHAQLRDGNLEHITEKYKEKVIELKTTEMAVSDLQLYHRALDEALMRYHSAKMDEINQVIRDLWQITYKGNDIDTIEIVSDHSTEGKRTYNYRVVMKRGSTRLDMRGRCSAGQRVLACLVIRLALAETFCISCGILALDEPTTNLDKDNIQSLAQALANIIESRRQQSNFQLIVITHDVEFVNLLARHNVADHYMRVQKQLASESDRRMVSVVERQSVDGIFD